MWPVLMMLAAIALFVWAVAVGVTTLREVHHFYLGLLLFLAGWLAGCVAGSPLGALEWIGSAVALHDAVNHGYAAAWQSWPWLRETTEKLDRLLGKEGP